MRSKAIRELTKKKQILGHRLKGNKYTNKVQVFKDYVKFESVSKELEIQKAYSDHERG